MSEVDVLEDSDSTLESLQNEVRLLRAENERLKALLPKPPSAVLKVHYLYAAPLVLVDNLGSTVIETMDPIRADREFRSLASLASISVGTTSTLLRLKYLLDEKRASVLHISMHTVDLGRTIRCALEDETGRGYLMSPEEFAASLGSLDSVCLLFVNACKSVAVSRAILKQCPSIPMAVCLGDQEPVLEAAAQLFSSELYAALKNRVDVKSAFERAKLAIKTNASVKISSQADLFELIGGDNHLVFDSSGVNLGTLNFLLGHITPDLASCPEDFVGREVDIVRLCGILMSSAGRRIVSITGPSGIGKSTLLAEACKYMASPGGRCLAGGVCVVRLAHHIDSEEAFISSVIESLRDTVANLQEWNKGRRPIQAAPMVDDELVSCRPRVDSEDIPEELLTASSSLKSYKVFWAETFQSEVELVSFLESYQLQLPEESSLRLFTELRLNGTQLQDWGTGRLIRVVHVVRLLIRGENGQYLLENRGGQVRMLSKKFDPVTENVLEVASGAVKKELGTQIEGQTLLVTRLVLRDRKPMVEINRTSPSYPGLATKYVLYTADVYISNLPLERSKFVTIESMSHKVHAWEWTRPDSADLVSLLPASDALSMRKNSALEMQVSNNVITLVEKPLHSEFFRLLKEWVSLSEERKSALVLLGGEAVLEHVGPLLGKALTRHPGLRILISSQNKPAFNLSTASVSYKIVHFPLAPLQSIDSAVLFTRRIHRPLFPRDWWIDTDEPPPPLTSMSSRERLMPLDDEDTPLVMHPKSSKGLTNLARLARHPLLVATGGIPYKILKVAMHVTSDLVSINELVDTDF
jgi:hypothetical protein